MLSANPLNLDLCEILSFGKGLSNYHPIPQFAHERNIALKNIVRKGEIACNKGACIKHCKTV